MIERKQTLSKAWIKNFLTRSIVCILLFSNIRMTFGQTVRTPEIRTRLETMIELKLGRTEIANIMESLSKQTGVTIKAEPYIERHKLFISMKKVSATQALSSISEMNQWRWLENSEGEIVLTHLTPKRPENLKEFAEAFMKTLPIAWRPFMGLDIDYSRIITDEMLANDRKELAEIEQIEDPGIRAKVLEQRKGSLNSTAMHFFQMRYKISMGDEPFLKRLFPNIRDVFASEKPTPYVNWTEAEKNAVLRVSILNLFSVIYVGNPLMDELFSGNMRSFIQHPETCNIMIQGGGLVLGELDNNPDRNPKSSKMFNFVGHSLEFLERKSD